MFIFSFLHVVLIDVVVVAVVVVVKEGKIAFF